MPTKNESLWLASGQAGENQARALNLPITFSKVVVGDANGAYPPMDSAIISLVNERLEGAILSHEVDPNDVNQRIIQMDIPPKLDFDAVELLLFAKYGETEFAHTYFRLAAPYPVRTVGNGGSQVKLKYTIRVNQDTDVSVFVSPNLSYLTNEQLKNDLKPMKVTAPVDAITDKSKLHIFTAIADLTIPDDDGGLFFVKVDKSVDLSSGECRVLNANGDELEFNGNLVDAASITQTSVTIAFTKINGVWQAESFVQALSYDDVLCHLFAPNHIVKTLNGVLSSTRSTPKTIRDRYGWLQTVPVDELAINEKGCLIEASSHNSFANSSVDNYTAWLNDSDNTLTVEANTLRANGDGGAVLVTNTMAQAQRIHNSSASPLAYVANSKVTASCMVKNGNGGGLRVRFYGDGGVVMFKGDKFYNIDTRTASSGTNSVSLLDIESFANGWDRVSFNFESSVDVADLVVEFYTWDVDDIVNKSMYIDFMQFENLPFASSIIISGATPATRAHDNVSAQFRNNVPLSDRTIAADVELLGVYEIGANARRHIYSSLGTESSNHMNGFLYDTTDGSLKSVSGIEGNSGSGIFGDITEAKGTFVWRKEADKISLFKDGEQLAENSRTTPLMFDSLHIGSQYGTSRFLWGYIKNFRIFDRALTADEVKSL